MKFRASSTPSRASGARRSAALAALLCLAASAVPAAAGPYIWDQDEDGLDDRMETVQVSGYRFAFEDADSLKRARFEIGHVGAGVLFGVYVVYGHAPTTQDLVALNLRGIVVQHRLASVPAVHGLATFAQASLARSLPGVERIEVVPLLYPMVRDGTAAIGVRDATSTVFPAWETPATGPPPAGGPAVAGEPSRRGEGVIVAILDTGVNDAPDGGYPGHEGLVGRSLGGADFSYGDSLLDTPTGGSVNPQDDGGVVTHAHATHVAGIVLGTGGPSAYAIGVAPAARFVDVKVLGNLGSGSGVAEAIDWCIANKDRHWGDPDPEWRGIDVINLSLSSLDESDGNDVASQAAARAVEQGIVVVASIGNDGLSGHVPSPAAGDGVIAVGAWDVQRSGDPDDDGPADFSNTGPRAGDGDADAFDEQKPTVLAPGVAVLGPDGDPNSDGAQYRRATGTSAATAFVSGVVALLESAYPDLTPAGITSLLAATSRRNLPGLAPGTAGADPRWDSARGFGLVDAYAAGLEAADPAHTQVRRFALRAGTDDIAATVWTQRERGAATIAFERAPDETGAPGAFSAFDSVAVTGDSSLTDAANLAVYTRTWPVPVEEHGVAYWYRTAFTEGGQRFAGPARRFSGPVGPSVVTLEATIVHNAYDHDVDAVFETYGAAPGGAGPVTTLTFPLPGSSAAVATEWVSGTSSTGNVSQTFRIEIPAQVADAFLPPSNSTPWSLVATEGGYLNRSGRIESFRLTWHSPGGDVSYDGVPAPALLIEGGTTTVRIPAAVTAVEPVPTPRGLFLSPNPVPSGASVSLVCDRNDPAGMIIYDLSGRLVGRAPLSAGADGRYEARWATRDARGAALAPGVYFARVGPAPARRLVVVAP